MRDDTRDAARDVDVPPAIALHAIDPTRDGARFDAAIRAIAIRAATEVEGRRAARTVLGAIGAWAVPAAAAALVVLVGSIVALVATPSEGRAAPASFAESAGIPAPVVAWALDPEASSSTAAVMSAADLARRSGR